MLCSSRMVPRQATLQTITANTIESTKYRYYCVNEFIGKLSVLGSGFNLKKRSSMMVKLKNGFNDGLMELVFHFDLLRYDAHFNKCLKQGVKPFTRHLNCARLEQRIFTLFLNEVVV